VAGGGADLQADGADDRRVCHDQPDRLAADFDRQVGRSLKMALVIAPVVITGYVIGLRYGAEGVALGYSIGMVILIIPMLLWAVGGSAVSFETSCGRSVAVRVGAQRHGCDVCGVTLQRRDGATAAAHHRRNDARSLIRADPAVRDGAGAFYRGSSGTASGIDARAQDGERVLTSSPERGEDLAKRHAAPSHGRGENGSDDERDATQRLAVLLSDIPRLSDQGYREQAIC